MLWVEAAASELDKPIKDCLATQHDQTDNQKMIAEKHNDGKIAIIFLIVGAGLITYNVW